MKKENEIIFGRHPVEEALDAGASLIQIYIAKGSKPSFVENILSLGKKRGIPVEVTNKSQIEKLADGQNHQGILAIMEPFKYSSLDAILKLSKDKGEDPFILVLDHIQDPYNLGGILRTAEAAGVHGVIIPQRRAAGVTAGVYKASVGAVEYLSIAQVVNIARTLEELKEKGLWIAGADMAGEKKYTQEDLKGSLVLVIGGEEKGLSRLTKEKCDFLLKLPMLGKINSLNASVAGGILIYEVLRQRQGW